MQQAVIDHALRAMADPRLHGLLGDFYALRGGALCVDNPALLDRAIGRLLDVIAAAVGDELTLRVAEGEAAPAALTDALDCVQHMRELVAGPAFDDATIVLFLLCEKVGWGGGATSEAPEEVLARVDDFLRLCGVGASVSVLALWNSGAAPEHAGRRDDLWVTVRDLLSAVRRGCRRRDAPA